MINIPKIGTRIARRIVLDASPRSTPPGSPRSREFSSRPAGGAVPVMMAERGDEDDPQVLKEQLALRDQQIA